MSLVINSFKEYEAMYKRIINHIEIDDKFIKTYLHDTSFKHPFSFDNTHDGKVNRLFINRKYYNKHKKEINALVVDTLGSTTKYNVSLNSKELVTNDTIDAVIGNHNLKELNVCSERPLTKEEINKLLASDLYKLNCAINFEDNPDMLYYFLPGLKISNYPIVAGTTVEDFGNEMVHLMVNEELTDVQLDQLKKLFDKYPQRRIKISFKDFSKIKSVMDIIKADEIIIINNNLYTKEHYRFFEDNYDNVYFDVAFDNKISPQQLRKQEEIFELIIKEVKTKDLSPCEQYIYLYNIVKMYKEYKEAPNNKDRIQARNSSFTLFNDYMVCVGYASLLDELVTKLGNPNLSTCEYSCHIKDKKTIGHSRILTKINDDKYGIDGIYISDPTWDSITYYKKFINENGQKEINYTAPIANIDLYNHLLMTKEEMHDEKIVYDNPDVTDVLFSNNLKLNSEETGNTYNEYIYYKVQECIQKLFRTNCDNTEEMVKAINVISQPPISSDTIISAVRNIYSKIYVGNNEQIETMVQKTIHDNNISQKKKFNLTANKFSNESSKNY